MNTEEMSERPQKRVKLSDDSTAPTPSSEVHSNGKDASMAVTAMKEFQTLQDSKETDVGITTYVDVDTLPFYGVLKQRYTDFMVNEILLTGEVLHLQNTSAPKFVGSEPNETNESKKEENVKQDPSDVPASEGQIVEAMTETVIKTDQPISNGKGHVTVDNDSSEVTEEDERKLVEYFNEVAVKEIMQLYQSILRSPHKKPRDHPTVRTNFTSDRDTRTRIHQSIRTIFKQKIESSTDKDGVLVLTASSPNSRWNRPDNKQQQTRDKDKKASTSRPGKLGWIDRGGEYLHFTLYKENKDTMEAITWLTRQLRVTAKTFQFAGTKDRRAVTAQRCSAYRIDAHRLASQNKTLRNSAVGDFEYHSSGLELGDLRGNEFVITLRDCRLATEEDSNASIEDRLSLIQKTLSPAVENLYHRGFLNYFGLQRFGTFSTRTDTVGLHILRGDFKAACEAILNFHPAALAAAQSSTESETIQNIGQDDKARALAIHTWHDRKSSNPQPALDLLPRKFSAESMLIRHLTKTPTDYLNALMCIQRNMRLMYVHAYQSLIWNHAITERWRLFGSAVQEGDLVLINEHKDKESNTDSTEPDTNTIDADGELVIHPSGPDRSTNTDDIFERARHLTQTEAESGKYTIFDIVLPLPGYDIRYPTNASGSTYKTLMDKDGLDPDNMQRKQREFSLSGGYRKMLSRTEGPGNVSVHAYTSDEEQFVTTDMERLQKSKQNQHHVKKNGAGDEEAAAGNKAELKVAAVLTFQLGSSQYATMALRELSKGGVLAYKPEFGGGR